MTHLKHKGNAEPDLSHHGKEALLCCLPRAKLDVYKKNFLARIQDGDTVGGSFTQLLPGPNWNYNYIIEQWSWITNWKLAEEKSYDQGFTKEVTSRLVGRVEMQKGLALLPWVVVEVPKGYLSCRGSPWETYNLNSKPGSPVQRIRAKKRHPHNICLWKQQGFGPKGRDGNLLETQESS